MDRRGVSSTKKVKMRGLDKFSQRILASSSISIPVWGLDLLMDLVI